MQIADSATTETVGPPRLRWWGALLRGARVGALAGVSVGVVDYFFAAQPAHQYLTSGAGGLCLFLAALYGAGAALAGAVLGAVVIALDQVTELGTLWRSTFSMPAGSSETNLSDGVRRWTYIPASLLGVSLHGGAIYGVALTATVRFHGKFLIAALVGACGAIFAIPALLFVFLVAGVLSRLVPLGTPAKRLRLSLSATVVATILWIGLGVGALAVMQRMQYAQGQVKLSQVARASMVAWQAALVFLVVILSATGVIRWLDRRAANKAPSVSPLRRPAVTLAVLLVFTGAAVAGALAWQWSIAKLLPLRALGLGALLVVGGAILHLLLPRWRSLGAAASIVVTVVLPASLLFGALQVGRSDRVRKAAMQFGALTAPLVDGLHELVDFDRDGYSPLLGSDCNDFNPEIHPGAFDWPDDGIDQNCNGHEATTEQPPRPQFSAVPDVVPRQPDIVLISIDAIRADHVSAYGYGRKTTPRIDELASESVRFANGWAPSPSTRYSIPAMLTGRYESSIAWGNPSVHWPPQVLPENRLLSEMLKEHGYHTGALVPAHYFEPTWGLPQGFDDYDNSLAHLHTNPFGGDPARAAGSSSRQLADLAIDWINRQSPKQEPFFLWMHFYDPHYVYEKHAEAPDFGDTDLDRYDNEVAFTDMHVGRVLDALRKAGRWDRTVVIVTGDHGDGLGEHGVKQHGYHIYVQQNRVPFIVRVPGVAPRVAQEPIGSVDLFPTFLNLLRAPDEPQLQGRSFVDLLLGAESPRLVFQEVDFEGPTSRKAVASRTHQLIYNVVPDATMELYDLAHDPQEEVDLFRRGQGGEQAQLEAALGEWMDESALPRDFAKRVAGCISRTPIAPENPLGTRLELPGGGALVIDGFDAPARQVRPGEQAEISFVMHLEGSVPPGWRVFTHARPDRQATFVNLDHEPVEGFLPLAKLRSGQWVRDRIRFTVPPAWPNGPVAVEFGLWKGPTRAVASGPGAEGNQIVVRAIEAARATP